MTHPPHWAYYASIEDDLVAASRYVEICDANLDTYSIQFARLLLAAGSEVDVVAKILCAQIDPDAKQRSIDDYRDTIALKFPAIPRLIFGIEWNDVRIAPWASWGEPSPSTPDWWRAYNNVKHERNSHFKSANLRYTLDAVAGLYCLVRHLEEDRGHPRPERFIKILPASN